jgi:pimeloyl-ACP methyl ester carboxylesterase
MAVQAPDGAPPQEDDGGMERFTNAAFSSEVTDTAAAGGDGPEGVAILVHGFPQNRRCWDRVTSALAGDGYRVLAPDLRGYSPGARPTARSAYRNSQLAAEAFAQALITSSQAARSWYMAA